MEQAFEEWAAAVRSLAEERRAVILAHNYALPWIQDVADHVGDSLALSRLAAKSTADVIVFCGVHFMAETAKILAPDKTVLLPAREAGCSLAETVTAADIVSWRGEHPDGLVVAYVNTSASVKAEADVCCTSSNAAEVVASLPEGPEVLFLPDFFLGQHVERVTGRKLDIWMGECHVHAGIDPASLRRRVAEQPEATIFIHPECGCTSTALYLLDEGVLPPERTKVLSTGAMVDEAGTVEAGRVLVATETGILHQLRKANPRASFEAVNPSAVCRYMKMTTPDLLLESLERGVHEITVEESTRQRAERAVRKMIEIGTPSRAGE